MPGCRTCLFCSAVLSGPPRLCLLAHAGLRLAAHHHHHPQDKFLKFKYDKTTVEAGKAFAKSQLQREVGLPVDPSAPLFGFIGG